MECYHREHRPCLPQATVARAESLLHSFKQTKQVVARRAGGMFLDHLHDFPPIDELGYEAINVQLSTPEKDLSEMDTPQWVFQSKQAATLAEVA